MAEERLQKIMAAAGVASRRKSEELIAAGRVSINGEVVSTLGAKADPERDHIRVDGKLLHGAERRVYLLLNKPKGYVSTVTDPEGRPTVMDLVRGVGARLFPVGRLDYLSEGLLLLTNDGELMQRLTRAASHVPKTYLVKISGKPSEDAIERLRGGIMLPPESRPGEGKKREPAVKTAPAQITLTRDAENPWYEVVLTEGRNRQIRRMFKQVGHNVEKIKRVRYGTLELDVPPGEYRRLTPDEVARLMRNPQARVQTTGGKRPTARKPSERPAAYKPSDRPTAYKANAKPVSRKPSERPAAYKPSDRPTAYKASDRPTAYKANAKPLSRKLGERPAAHKANAKPVSHKASDRPTAYWANVRAKGKPFRKAKS
jgi:23S rRNA pseudouridine2605 synthase